MARRVLLTGGSGFVGNRLARRLVADGQDVHLLLRPDHSPGRLADLPQVTQHLADIADGVAVHQVVARVRPSWIFHLAVYGAYSWQNEPEQMVRTNILGTSHLVEAAVAQGFDAFVNTGSSSEYGFQAGAPDEKTPPAPNSYYAVTKSAATAYCTFAARHHDVQLTTLRLYSVYGPGEDRRRLLPSLIAAGLENRWPPLAAPDTARDYVYIDDVLDAYLLAATTPGVPPGAVYNVGRGVQTTLAEVAAVAAEVLKIDTPPQWSTMAGRAWDTTSWVADRRRITRELGWEPTVDLPEGISDMAAAWPWL